MGLMGGLLCRISISPNAPPPSLIARQFHASFFVVEIAVRQDEWGGSSAGPAR